MITQILLPVTATLVAYLLYHALQILYNNLTSPLRNILSGPPNPNLLIGNFKEMAEDARLSSRWREEYGKNFIFHGLFSISELHTSDLKALNHIMSHAEIYQRATANRDNSRRLMGEVSRKYEPQRRFLWTKQFSCAISGRPRLRSKMERERGGVVEVFSGLRKMTLDVIGRAGFGYEFNALEPGGQYNELNQVFTDLFHSPKSNLYGLIRLAQGHIPILKLLPLPGIQVTHSARTRMDTIGRQIIKESKARLLTDQQNQEDKIKALGGRRDLLSILLKSNMSPGLPESQRLSEAEIISQIPAFFVAGHETTSAATAWALHVLSMDKPVQDRLRDEVAAVGTDNPTFEEVNGLPFLEKVLRETLRLYAPVMFMQRKAMADDVLPLAKPVVDSNGREHWNLPIRKGQMIHIPMWAVNTATDTWGEDALEFKPDRWDNIPEAASAVPGVWGNLFTFFAGPHNCIGFRFSIAELKIILFTLIRAFEVSPALPEGGIGPVTAGVMQRPAVLAEQHKGSGLPLVLRPIQTIL
ncbi:hypothetical protein MIND_00810700 [Mycena indigotica]|uniref:Cytochrome P450 n=1 Tax=Mycena indigotica TaxID=2126181 RepID=A0A8H6W0K8_9AGAR|nr:uncharacterized protein MIND_00810700 [Mycena indigotica]KAF7298636.1 hypothetical protein MIND_00810700 [Mycena indigotica]